MAVSASSACPSRTWMVRRSAPASSMCVAKLCLRVCGVMRFSMPALFRASFTAVQTTFVVMGTSARQFFTVPGNSQVFGFIHREYSRNVSSSAMHEALSRVDKTRDFLLTQHRGQRPLALRKRDLIVDIGPLQCLPKEEAKCRCSPFDRPRGQLPVPEQMNLILPDMLRPEPIWRATEVHREVFDRVDVGPYGVRRVVAALEFVQHHLA